MPYVYVKKNAKGEERWYYQFKDYMGHRHTMYGGRTRSEAKQAGEVAESKARMIRQGLLPVPKASDTPRPMVDVIKQYLEWGRSQGGHGGRPWSKDHSQHVEMRLNYWADRLAGCHLHEIKLDRVEAALQYKRTTGKSGKTINDYAAVLNALIEWAMDRSYLDNNPIRHLTLFDTTPKTRRRALTADELVRLFEATPEPRRGLYELAAMTGLRVNELRTLYVRDLDPERGLIRLFAENTKNRKAALQPAPADLLRRLTAGRGLDELVFPFDLIHITRHLAKDLDTAKIPNPTLEGKFDFHAFRNTYISLVIERGASVKEAQELARHSTPQLTMNVYARTNPAKKAAVVDRLAGDLLQRKPEEGKEQA